MSNQYTIGRSLLYVENLSVAYGEKTIIKDINFVEKDVIRKDRIQGQVVAFVGRSGRGKSTLFKAITGLIEPTTGKVLIPDETVEAKENGEQPAKLVKEGDVGFVNQTYTLFRHKTVYQSLMFALRKSGLSKAEKQEKIMSYLSTWGLEKVKDQFPCELSGGQRQRTAIIEQILSSGHYIVMDEPFSGLDVGNIISVKQAFQLINQSDEANTIIFSTHDIDLAVELADSVYIIGHKKLGDGSLSSYGTLVRHYDIKELGFAWEEFGSQHSELVKKIKADMLDS